MAGTAKHGSHPAMMRRLSLIRFRYAAAQPLVSILVHACNGARVALDSLLAQNIEIVLLDDASTDATPQVATEHAGRIQYIRQPRNLGIYEKPIADWTTPACGAQPTA